MYCDATGSRSGSGELKRLVNVHPFCTLSIVLLPRLGGSLG